MTFRSALRPAVFGVAALLVTATATAAWAAQPSSAQIAAVQAACGADFKAVCAGIQPGGGRIAACAKANFTKLSPPCQQALLAAKSGG